jgi:hypothetical protein
MVVRRWVDLQSFDLSFSATFPLPFSFRVFDGLFSLLAEGVAEDEVK